MAKSKKRGPAQKSKSSYAQELQMKKQLGANIIADRAALPRHNGYCSQ